MVHVGQIVKRLPETETKPPKRKKTGRNSPKPQKEAGEIGNSIQPSMGCLGAMSWVVSGRVYNPYKWSKINGFAWGYNSTYRVITPFISGRGPPCKYLEDQAMTCVSG